MKNIVMSTTITCLACTGCVTGYSDVPTEQAGATVVFEKGYQKENASGNLVQGYIIYEDGNCNKARNAANFTGLHGDTKVRRVSTNTPLVFIAAINERDAPTVFVDGFAATCSFKAEFQPRDGYKYRIRNSGTGTTCKVEVTDYETGTPVTDLKVEGAFKSDVESPRKNYLGYPCE